MLQYRLLKNHAGIALIGDYLSLRQLHKTLVAVSEADINGWVDPQESLKIFAYYVEQAYETKRMRLPPPTHNGDIGPRFKVNILWPMFLYQVAVLRSGLAFFDSQKQHQANAYWLEYIAEASVTEAFGTQAPAIIEQIHRLRACAPAGEPIALHGRMALFYSWSKQERKSRLNELLLTFDPMYKYIYKMTARYRSKEKARISPEEIELLESTGSYPDPRWL